MCRGQSMFPLCATHFACHHRGLTTGGPLMRWYVSIGAVLVEGAMAGGDVAGIAAPNSHSQFANPPVHRAAARDPTVDVELVLAVDVSYSMDMEELAIQREGYAQAITSTDFLKALKTGPHGKVA